LTTYINKLYLQLFVFIYLLYIIFNKGVSYSYLTELVVIIGIVLTLSINKSKLAIVLDTNYSFLLFFLFVGLIYFIYGIYNFKIKGVIQDSLFFLYMTIVFILITFLELYNKILTFIFNIYKWVPIIGVVNFILQNYSSFFDQFILFGGIPLMLYKYGDLGVNLIITTILFLEGKYHLNKPMSLIFIILTLINVLLVLTYSRSGFIAYTITLFCYYIYSKSDKKINFRKNLKYIFFSFLIAIPLYLSFEVKQNFQGRTTGLNQIISNFNSFITNSSEFKFNNTLNNNIIWRLAWWSNIINNTIEENKIFSGIGSGADLIKISGVVVDDEKLRAPHSIHFNLLARYGFLFFLFWIFFIFHILRPLFLNKLNGDQYLIALFILAFLINASFDVYLEGPMGSFPFWTFIGLFLLLNKKNFTIAKS
jgi:hypothetical protein